MHHEGRLGKSIHQNTMSSIPDLDLLELEDSGERIDALSVPLRVTGVAGLP